MKLVNHKIKKPELSSFKACCNEFWWLSTYVAKGLRRNQVIYAIDFLNIIRAELMKMIEFQICFDTKYSVNTGSHGKFLEKFLSQDTWNKLLETYANADIENIWNALFKACDMFEETARYVSERLFFIYNFDEGRKTKKYLLQMRDNEIN